MLEGLPLPNIKWICPTAPTRPLAAYGGYPCPAWFDAKEFSEEAPDDWDDLDASVAHVANLLSTEPADIKLGVGGFSMGAATALYCAMCHAVQRYGNGVSYQVNLQAVVALSGCLPCSSIKRIMQPLLLRSLRFPAGFFFGHYFVGTKCFKARASK